MMRKRRLAYFLHDIAVGGAEVAFLSALPLLHSTFDVRIFVLGKVDPRLMERIAEPIRHRMVCLHIARWALIFHLPRIHLLLRSFKPDILISSLWRSAIPATVYKWAVGKRVNYMVLLHSSGFFHWADRFFIRKAMHISDAVLADSRATEVFARKCLTGRRVPVATLSYLTEPTPEQPVEHHYSGTKRFCYLGKLHRVKRVTLAVSAIGWLREHGIDATLDVFGRDEGEGAAINASIQQTGLQSYVHVHGEVSPFDKVGVYRSFPFYIQLSVQEGMAMSVAEAMQHGMICVVTPVGEIPNYAADGVSAVMLDPTSAESWELSLHNLLAVLKSEEKCRSIAQAAHGTFKHASVFSDSLIAAINQFAK